MKKILILTLCLMAFPAFAQKENKVNWNNFISPFSVDLGIRIFTNSDGYFFIWRGQGAPDIKNLNLPRAVEYGPMPKEYYMTKLENVND